VWLGTSGNLIYGLANKPYAPQHLVFIGVVTRVNANNGEIFVKVQNGFELNETHDVDLKTVVPVNGDVLGYNGTLWVNKTIAAWLGYTPANDADVAHLNDLHNAVTLGTANGLSLNTQELSLGLSSSTTSGALSSSHWTNFNNAYNDKVNSISVVKGTFPVGGVIFNTLTLNQQDGTTLTTSWQAAYVGTGSAGYVPRFTTNATELVNSVIYDNGTKIGIGTTNVNAKLEVVYSQTGPIPTEQRAAIFANNTSTDAVYANSVGIYAKTATTGGYAVYAENTSTGWAGYFLGKGYFSGNVGIGTTTPIGKLNVHGGTGDGSTYNSIFTLSRISSTGNALAGKIVLTNTDTNWADMAFRVKTTASGSELDSYYTDALIIKGSTGAATFASSVTASSLYVPSTSFGVSPTPIYQDILKYGNSTGTSIAKIQGGNLNNSDFSTYLKFIVNGTTANSNIDALTILPSGRVGIGTTSPVNKLHVTANVDGITALSAQLAVGGFTDLNKKLTLGYDTTSNYGFIQPLIAGTSYSNLVINPSGGNVGIGTITPGTSANNTLLGFSNGSNIQARTAVPQIAMSSNIDGDWYTPTYKTSNFAGQIYIDANQGAIALRTASSGTVGSSITWNTPAVYITNDSRVGIGITSPSSSLHIKQDSFNLFRLTRSTLSDYSFELGGSGEFYIKNNLNSIFPISILSNSNVGIGTTTPLAKLHIIKTELNTSQKRVEGNSNTQGSSNFITWVKQVPVVSLGTKLIIPFVSQGTLNSTTLIRIMGHSARFNDPSPSGFDGLIQVAHLSSLSNVSAIRSSGNMSGVTVNGMNLEINFTSAYTSATANGIFVTIEYMTNRLDLSIDVANIRMN
jgi:hypothetical protein